jgi:O-antigen ligase
VGAGFAFTAVALMTWFFGAWDLDISAKILSLSYVVRIATMLIIGWAASEYFTEQSDKTTNHKLQTTTEFFFKRFFLISGVVIALGFIQFVFVPDISLWSTEGGWDPHTGRLLGTWLDPNYLAGFLGFLFPVIAGSWYQKRIFWLLLLGGATLVALFLTFSRSGYVAAMVGIGFFFLLRDWKIILLASLVAIFGLAMSERAQQRVEELTGTLSSILLQDTDEIDPTATLRIQNWIKSADLWKKYPVMGIGYNTYRWRAAEEGVVDESFFSSGGADGTHLTVLVTTGIIGFLAYLWFLWSLFWRPIHRWWQTKDERQLGFAMGFLSLVIHSLFVNSLFFPLIFLPVLVIAGVLQPEKVQQEVHSS